jgi:hypothetical protein
MRGGLKNKYPALLFAIVALGVTLSIKSSIALKFSKSRTDHEFLGDGDFIARSRNEKHAIVLGESDSTLWSYECWDGENLVTPIHTIATVVAGLPRKYTEFLQKNRLVYAAQQGYR